MRKTLLMCGAVLSLNFSAFADTGSEAEPEAVSNSEETTRLSVAGFEHRKASCLERFQNHKKTSAQYIVFITELADFISQHNPRVVEIQKKISENKELHQRVLSKTEAGEEPEGEEEAGLLLLLQELSSVEKQFDDILKNHNATGPDMSRKRPEVMKKLADDLAELQKESPEDEDIGLALKSLTEDLHAVNKMSSRMKI